MTEKIEPSVPGPVLARWLGVSGKAVYDLAKAGIIERAGGGLYALEPSVRGYCEHLRRNGHQEPGEQGAKPRSEQG